MIASSIAEGWEANDAAVSSRDQLIGGRRPTDTGAERIAPGPVANSSACDGWCHFDVIGGGAASGGHTDSDAGRSSGDADSHARRNANADADADCFANPDASTDSCSAGRIT